MREENTGVTSQTDGAKDHARRHQGGILIFLSDRSVCGPPSSLTRRLVALIGVKAKEKRMARIRGDGKGTCLIKTDFRKKKKKLFIMFQCSNILYFVPQVAVCETFLMQMHSYYLVCNSLHLKERYNER